MRGFTGQDRPPNPDKIADLFNNQDPEITWQRVTDVVRRMNPGYDFTLVRSLYDDVLRLFRGDYPGYAPIQTLYHDLSHTLEVLLCGVRLMHGVHVSGERLKDDEITLVMLTILLHDVGYAQRRGEDSGTGAQYTQTHVSRSIEFMQNHFSTHELPPHIAAALPNMILGTDHIRPFTRIQFSDDRARMLARIVATADIVGQMADRIYLEKLLFLYLEFKEAQFGSYQSMHDLLRRTNRFYEVTREKLDGVLGGIYQKLEFHFRDTLGVGNNYYLEAIEKNMAYLAKIVAHDETEIYAMLKRNGVAERSRSISGAS